MEDHSNYICFRWSVSYFAVKWLKSCTETSQTKLSLMQILSTSMQCSHCHHLLQTQKRWHLPHFFSFYKMLFFDNTNCKFLFFSLNIDILHLLLYSKQILRKKKKPNHNTTTKTRGKISLILAADLQRVITQLLGPEHFKKPDVFPCMEATTGTWQLRKSVHRDLL